MQWLIDNQKLCGLSIIGNNQWLINFYDINYLLITHYAIDVIYPVCLEFWKEILTVRNQGRT